MGQEEQYEKVYAVKICILLIYILGIEDLMADRLNACVHWKSQGDRTWAREPMVLHVEEIDGIIWRRGLRRKKSRLCLLD